MNIDSLNDKKLPEILIHEIQHVVQFIENFAKGGSPKYVREQIRREISSNVNSLKQKIAKIESEEQKNLVENYLNALNEVYLTNDDKNGYYSTKAKKLGKLVGREWKKICDDFSETNQRLRMFEESDLFSDRTLYNYLGGEQEANHAMYRAKYQPKGMPKPHDSNAIIIFGDYEFPADYSMENEELQRNIESGRAAIEKIIKANWLQNLCLMSL